MGISWQDKVPNTEVLSRAGLPSMFTLLRQRRLRWLGHVHRMPDGRIPKDLLYGELATGSRRTGRPQLRYRDVVKRDMKAVGIDTETWENLAADPSQWRGAVTKHLKTGEDKLPQIGGPAESFVSALSNSQHTHATLATRTAIHASVFTVIAADAPAKHTTRMLYPWSTLTDGGLLIRFLLLLPSQLQPLIHSLFPLLY